MCCELEWSVQPWGSAPAPGRRSRPLRPVGALRRLRQLLACMATADDSVRIWPVPQGGRWAEPLGRPVEHTPWHDRVI